MDGNVIFAIIASMIAMATSAAALMLSTRPPRDGIFDFRPNAIYHADGGFTEIVLEDTGTVWHDLGWGTTHDMEAGYAMDDGRLVAVRVHGIDLAKRPRRDKHELQEDLPVFDGAPMTQGGSESIAKKTS